GRAQCSLRPQVSPVWAQLPKSGGNDGRAELKRRSRHDLPVGLAVCAGIQTGRGEATRRIAGWRASGPIYIGRLIPPVRPSTFSSTRSVTRLWPTPSSESFAFAWS